MRFNETDMLKVIKLAEESKRLQSKGKYDAAFLNRSEFFNLVASQCKREEEEIPIYIMAIIEEAEKKGMRNTALYFSSLLAVYCSTHEGEDLLEAYHGYAMEHIDRVLTLIDRRALEQELEREAKSYED